MSFLDHLQYLILFATDPEDKNISRHHGGIPYIRLPDQ